MYYATYEIKKGKAADLTTRLPTQTLLCPRTLPFFTSPFPRMPPPFTQIPMILLCS